MKLAELLKQDHFASLGQEAMLNVVVTGNWLLSELAATTANYNITSAQYNVLRILRGSHPQKLTCGAIGDRLIDRTPDVTRLLNRLDRQGFIERGRAQHDRRIVEVSITEKGLSLLARMQAPMDQTVEQVTCHLSSAEQRQLSMLLEKMRTEQASHFSKDK